jgi:putative membrane protein
VEAYLRTGDRRSQIPVLVALLIAFAIIEWLGVCTGFPFGRYSYTDRWWPAVALPNGGFYPLVVPFAWLMITGGSYLFAVAACLDLVMEQVMTSRLDYWRWTERGPLPGQAPVTNSAAWFGLGVLSGTSLWLVQSRSSREGRWIEAAQAGLLVIGCQFLLVLCLAIL